jgi:hypothetical protein
MTDIVDGVDLEDSSADPNLIALQSMSEVLGPRRVKTKDMEIESHPIEQLQRVQERNSPKQVGFGQFRYDVAVPNRSRFCPRRYCE